MLMSTINDIATGRERMPIRVRRPSERRSLSRSATRALDVLELFGQAARPLRAIEISKAMDLHPSTANQLLKTMVDSAHLTFDAQTKAYFPSPRLAPFSAWMTDTFGADNNLRSLVRDAQAATGEIVTLSTPNDIFMQILDRAGDDARADQQATERGLRVSMFGTALGAAYLSTLASPQVMRLIDRARIRQAEIPETLAEIDAVRRSGVAEGLVMNGAIWSMAAALPPTGYPAPLVLGIAGPVERVTGKIDVMRRAMRDALKRCQVTAPHPQDATRLDAS
jgi:DNA-binding IclR family transcriptional regulator